jgi:hypothetical protein
VLEIPLLFLNSTILFLTAKAGSHFTDATFPHDLNCMATSRFKANPNATSAALMTAVGMTQDGWHPAFSALTKTGFRVKGTNISLNPIWEISSESR